MAPHQQHSGYIWLTIAQETNSMKKHTPKSKSFVCHMLFLCLEKHPQKHLKPLLQSNGFLDVEC